MKIYVYVSLAVFIMTVFLSGNIANAEIVESDIMAWYSCEETSSVRYDATDNDNDLTDNNTVGYGTGVNGNACDFERDNTEYLSIAYASQTDFTPSDEWSLSMCFKLETLSSNSAVFQMTDGTQKLYLDLASGQPRIYTASGNAYWSLPLTTPISASTWYHYVFTFDSSVVKLYIDQNDQGAPVSNTMSGDVSGTGANYIGASSVGGSPFDGLVDEWAMFNRVLTSTEVSSLVDGDGDCYSYEDLFATATTSTSSTSTTTSIDVSELIDTMSLYLSIIIFLIFGFLGYHLTKLFI